MCKTFRFVLRLGEGGDWQEGAMRLLLTVALSASMFSSSMIASEPTGASAHVRPQEDRVTRLLRGGVARSATLRALVDRIEASNVIV
jgi:hypothetical protein